MLPVDIDVREERASDVAAVDCVVRNAFASDDEPRIVRDLRDAGALALSLVALNAECIVGHLAFSAVTLHTTSTCRVEALALGPLSVEPEHQRRGVGTRLVEHGLTLLRGTGTVAVFVLGYRTYYPRFGFKPAQECGFRCEFDAPPEAFMVLEVQPSALPAGPGLVRYRSEFG